MIYRHNDGGITFVFGYGDIIVATGKSRNIGPQHADLSAITLRPSKRTYNIGEDISTHICIEQGPEVCPPIQMSFTKTESIDVMIEALRRCRKYLKDNEAKTASAVLISGNI